MPKTDTPQETRNLMWYAAAAAAATVLPAQAVEAQVVYTDVDPDETAMDSSVDIDFDGDGTPEMAISENTTRVQTTVQTDPDGAQFVDAVIGNAFPYGTNTYAYVLPLDAGTDISGSNPDLTLLGKFAIPAQATFTFASADPNGWIGSTDAYVGVRFTGGAGTQHYGWIRVDFDAAGNVTIKDYAYESSAGVGIAAGATGVATEPGALEDGYLFSEVAPNPIASGRATFDLAVGEAETVSVDVFNAIGQRVQTVFSGALVPGDTETIELDTAGLPSGVYVVRVSGESFVSTRNVTVVR